jgi:hypothetical protein
MNLRVVWVAGASHPMSMWASDRLSCIVYRTVVKHPRPRVESSNVYYTANDTSHDTTRPDAAACGAVWQGARPQVRATCRLTPVPTTSHQLTRNTNRNECRSRFCSPLHTHTHTASTPCFARPRLCNPSHRHIVPLDAQALPPHVHTPCAAVASASPLHLLPARLTVGAPVAQARLARAQPTHRRTPYAHTMCHSHTAGPGSCRCTHGEPD